MNELLRTLTDQLKGAGGGSKAIAVLVGLAVAVAIGIAAVIANRPDWDPVFVNLSGHEAAQVCAALQEAGIPFDTNPGGASQIVYVDEGDRSAALAAAYQSGALDKPLKEVIRDPGVASLFDSALERRLHARKRECLEMEGILEQIDFVLEASVYSPLGDSASIGILKPAPASASVTLTIAGPTLSERQGEHIALQISRGLAVPRENIVVSDHEGNCLFDGTASDERGHGDALRDLLAYKQDFDLGKAREINEFFTETIGPRMVKVIVDSTWDFDQSVVRSGTSAQGAKLSESKSETETPIGDAVVGGPAGASSNMPGAGGSGTGSGADTNNPVSTEPLVAKSKESESKYAPSTSVEETVRTAPTLSKLSVALLVDDSKTQEEADAIALTVANALNYDAARDGGPLTAQRITFHTPDPAEAAEGEEGESGGGMSPMMELLVKRGLEVAVAIVFIFLLLKSLKGAKGSAGARGGAGGGSGPGGVVSDDEVDPELLARAQVEELIKADPDKVGEILSAWAREETTTTGAKS